MIGWWREAGRDGGVSCRYSTVSAASVGRQGTKHKQINSSYQYFTQYVPADPDTNVQSPVSIRLDIRSLCDGIPNLDQLLYD